MYRSPPAHDESRAQPSFLWISSNPSTYLLTTVSALYSQLKELQKKDADMKERDKMLYSKGDTESTSKLVARDTDLPLATTLLKAYAKVEPLTIAELNYLLSLLHPRTLTSYVPGELLALTWTKGGVMLHAPNAVKLQHTVSSIAICAMRQCSCCRDFPVRLHYRVEMAIADGTAEGAFFCFDGVVTKLHSLRASEAGQMLTFTITLILDERDRVPVPDVVDNIGSDDDGDDMPDGNPIRVKVETGGSSGEAAFNADTNPVGVRRRRRPTHLPRWLRRRVWLEID
ncbi:hypothetical protein Bca101_035675 [Brassica carinata]